eukprot:s2502_g14.t1
MSLDDKQEIEFAQFASYMKQPGQDLPAPGSNPTVTPQPAERAFPAQPPKGDAQGSAPEVATRPIPGRCLSFLLALQLRRPTKGPRGGAQGQGVPEVLPEDADTSPADPPLQGGRAKEGVWKLLPDEARQEMTKEIRALVQTRVQGPPPSATEVETKATNDLKGDSGRLKDLGHKKIRLQGRIDEVKAVLTGLYGEMKDLLQELKEAEANMDALAQAFKAKVLQTPTSMEAEEFDCETALTTIGAAEQASVALLVLAPRACVDGMASHEAELIQVVEKLEDPPDSLVFWAAEQAIEQLAVNRSDPEACLDR